MEYAYTQVSEDESFAIYETSSFTGALVARISPNRMRRRPNDPSCNRSGANCEIAARSADAVIGNPAVADVTMLKANQLMVVTGKSFGSTNLVVLDRTGSQIGESYITVVPSTNKVVVQRGAHRESFSCQPDCVPSINLGDDEQYLKNAIDSARTYEGASASRK